ncbi:MFS transporter, partial [Rhizobium johnstonii]
AAIVGGLFFSILGPATDVQSIGQSYSVAAVAIAICLLIAGWLSFSLTSTQPLRR